MSKPLIIFPKPAETLPRTSLSQTPRPTFFHPSKENQKGKFEKKITNLDTAIANEAITLSLSVAGLEPERLLVFEIKGEIEDFYKAVEKTEGMEFLGESFIGEEDPDDSFIYRKYDKETEEIIDDKKKISKRLFLTINNQSALNELKRYWDYYQKGFGFKHGTTKFRTLFEQLNDIREYSVRDRYEDTGILDYFKERLSLKEEEIFFELELTFRNDDKYLGKVFTHIKDLVEKNSGEIIESSHTIIKEIKYHAVIAKVPIELFYDLKEDTNISFFKCEQVLFFRPVGQSVIQQQVDEKPEENINGAIELAKSTELTNNPVIALLDGLPLQNHDLLQNKVIIDDPDNLEDKYPSNSRMHGTSMASLILYGDLNSDHISLLSSKIYIRPILTPILNPFTNTFTEEIPKDKLFIDVIHSAVKRLMEDMGQDQNSNPTIKIINLSIGDPNRPFLFNNSSWSRLIDWLSFKYNILFIISSGNYTEDIELDLDGQEYSSLTPQQKERVLISSIIKTNFNRKIIAPAESMNAITVGAFYDDEFDGAIQTNSSRVELLSNSKQLSPISRIGLGYLRSIKPDILMPGGRQLYRVNPLKSNLFKIDGFGLPPGHKVAYPDKKASNQGANFIRGTSNSAALATRFAARIFEVLENLSFESLTIPSEYYAVIIKSLLVHGATNENMELFYSIIGESTKTKLLPYIGHGFIFNEDKVITCTEQQVTLIGYGDLNTDQSHLYELPLPNEISSERISKQLTITLAWFSPINFSSNKYRKAALYIDNISGKNSSDKNIEWDGSLYDFNASKRGSVQQLKYKGTGADAYIEDSILKIKVNCREDAEKLTEKIKYGIAVTFELLDNTTINIYDEIRSRIAQKIRIN